MAEPEREPEHREHREDTRTRWRDRPTGELLVIAIAGTVCLTVIATVAALIIVAILHPSKDTAGAASQVKDIVNTLIGLLAGFLAGRSDRSVLDGKPTEPDDKP